MRLRTLLIGSITALLICFSVGNTTAQRTSGLNFISELEDYRMIRDMLPAYLTRLVAERLEDRERKIARIATPSEVASRRWIGGFSRALRHGGWRPQPAS